MAEFPEATTITYTPFTKGRYDVAPNLKALGTDFGAGRADQLWFQFDSRYAEFIEGKQKALAENRDKYCMQSRLSEEVEQAALTAIKARFSEEHPERHTKAIDELASLDDLAMLIQEDLCVVSTEGDQDWMSYAHVCGPSHWSAAEKIGHSFFNIHTVVPEFEPVNRVAKSMVDAMIRRSPFVRFVWGIESDTRPNHHPDPPPGVDPATWEGRDFSKGVFWVRAERQVIWGLPEVNAAVFTIRVSHLDGRTVLANPDLLNPLIASLHSMSPETREYKGLARGWDDLMAILENHAS